MYFHVHKSRLFGVVESASHPISGAETSLASIVVIGTPTDPINGNTFAIEVKHPAQLTVSPGNKMYSFMKREIEKRVETVCILYRSLVISYVPGHM